MNNEFRKIPSTQALLSNVKIEQLFAVYPRDLITELVRRELDRFRSSISGGAPCPSADDIADSINLEIISFLKPGQRTGGLCGGQPNSSGPTPFAWPAGS